MNAESDVRTAPSIKGHLIAPGAGHAIAIYERNGEFYVAEFRNGRGEFGRADTWFRFHSGILRYCPSRRAALEASVPLTHEMLQKIERLHATSEARQDRMLAVPWTVAASARRYWFTVISRLRGRAAKISQTFG